MADPVADLWDECPATEDHAAEEYAWLIIAKTGWIPTPELLFALKQRYLDELAE
jgi:hypothetical protein